MKDLPLLEQRKIEARVLVPIIRAFEKEVGAERAHAIVRDVIARIARDQGRALGKESPGTPIEKVKELVPAFSCGDALEIEGVEDRPDSYAFHVTRCRFAEFYKELGVPELGSILSCSRDFALAEGLHPDLRLDRTQTIMEGATHCDFRFRLREPPAE